MLAVASIITAAFMGSVIITPLYSLYQQKFGFSEITLTLVYAVYVVGNFAALLLFGQISDAVGRKRVSFPGLGLAACSALLFLFAHGTAWLYAGRLAIGLAVGILSGTGTAWLAEHFGPDARSEATVTAATANLVGIAVGPLLGGLLAQYGPAPLELPFVAYLVILAVVAMAIVRPAETRERRVARLRELRVRPRIGVTRGRLRSFTAPAVTGFVTFALGGLYFALIPTIVIRELHRTNVAVGGLVVFELGAIAAACIVLGRRLPPATSTRLLPVQARARCHAARPGCPPSPGAGRLPTQAPATRPKGRPPQVGGANLKRVAGKGDSDRHARLRPIWGGSPAASVRGHHVHRRRATRPRAGRPRRVAAVGTYPRNKASMRDPAPPPAQSGIARTVCPDVAAAPRLTPGFGSGSTYKVAVSFRQAGPRRCQKRSNARPAPGAGAA